MRNSPDKIRLQIPPQYTDSNGVPLYEWFPDLFSTHGMFTYLEPEEAEVWRTQNVTGSLRVPLTVNVAPDDRLEVVGKGKWKVRTVRENRAHKRLMLEQVK